MHGESFFLLGCWHDRPAQCHKIHITHSCLPKRGQPALFFRSSWPSPWLTEINPHKKVTLLFKFQSSCSNVWNISLWNKKKSQLIVNSSNETVSFVLCVDVVCLQDFDLLSICTGGKESSRCLYWHTLSRLMFICHLIYPLNTNYTALKIIPS